MQIREKGRQVICIKTEYVPEKKRTYGRTVASQPKHKTTVTEEVRQQLTKEEVDELQNWLDKRAEKESVDNMKQRLAVIARMMDGAASALDVDDIRNGLSSEQADEIWRAHDALSKSLRRHKFKKPKK